MIQLLLKINSTKSSKERWLFVRMWTQDHNSHQLIQLLCLIPFPLIDAQPTCHSIRTFHCSYSLCLLSLICVLHKISYTVFTRPHKANAAVTFASCVLFLRTLKQNNMNAGYLDGAVFFFNKPKKESVQEQLYNKSKDTLIQNLMVQTKFVLEDFN